MADVVLCAASTVAGCLVAPVGRLCGYVISYDSHVHELDGKVEELDSKRRSMEELIDDAQNNGKRIKADVNKWVKDVEKDAKEARRVLNDRRSEQTCFYGWLPNPKVRYRLGREARRQAKNIQILIDRKPSGKVYEDLPPGRVSDASNMSSVADDQGETDFESRASILEGIMNALDDEKHKVIGIYGQGGVGKTTLLEKVENILRNNDKKKFFHMIARASVSQNPDVKKIQDDIAYFLKLNLTDSEAGRKDLLFKRFKEHPNEKILIILDDLWGPLDLKAVGIPLGDESVKCKLLLTSRDKSVLEQKMRADRTFHLEGLSDEEAFSLFARTVGDKLEDDKELEAKAVQVVRKLAGLPLLITSVASTLKGSSVSTWDNALIKIEDSNIEKIVKWSYDHLEKEDAKSLFLLCGLIGGTIKVELLLGIGMGLGLFGVFNNTVLSSRKRLDDVLGCLRSACLLLESGDDKEHVTIHDLYSEVVVSTPFEGQNSSMMNSNYTLWSREKLEKCWAICLADVERDRLAELMTYQFPNLKILMLSQPTYWQWHPPRQYDAGDCSGLLDFKSMKGLQALYIRSIHISTLPSSIGILENLRSLYLDHCDVEDVAILGKLKALQILSLAGSALSRLPKEIGDLRNLRLLNPSNCDELRTIEPGVLKGLINLEELYLSESFDQWMGKDETPSESGNARLVELKSLTKITSLEISIPDPTILLEDDDFPFGNLIRFWINIGNARGRTIGGLRTMKLKLEERDSILSKDWVQKLLQKTQYLYLDGLKEFKNTHELCTQGFGELKHLDIYNSPSINYIVNSSDGFPPTAFTILESLRLYNLINLEKICNSLVALECFNILKVVSITQCPRLKNLWFLSEMQRLVHLEKLIVSNCHSMQAIITNDAGNIEEVVDDTVELPNLRFLDLGALPKMTSFCIGAEGAPIQVSLPRLESLRTDGLLGLEEILYNDPSMKYSNLKWLKITNSESRLKCFLKADWILKLSNLESMEIDNSPSIEVLFDMEELKLAGDAEILSRLTTLTLDDLQNLQCMWKQDVQLQGLSIFQNLGKLDVNNTRLPFLFPVYVAKCLTAIRDIKVRNCPFMKAVIVDEEGSDEGTYDVIEFPLLERLYIYKCPMKKFFSYSHGNKKSVTTNSDSQDANSDSFFDQKASLPRLKTLLLDFYSEEPAEWIIQKIWHGELPRSSFCELATLNIQNCPKLLYVFPSIGIGRLHNLESVTIHSCPSLKSLFDCGSPDENIEQTTISLPKLERVDVQGARKRRCMVKSDSQMIWRFPSLKEVGVHHCSDMRYLFPNFIATTLTQLEKISISHCEQMKEVVLEKGGGQSEADVMNFRSLVDLRIRNCPNLEAFIRSPTRIKMQLGEMVEENNEPPQSLFNEMVMFPNIKSLLIVGPQCKELWNNQIPANSFSKLEYLGLEYCDNLQCVAPSHMWKRLQCCLENLKVISCRSIKIIYEGDGTDTEGGKLRCLVLRNLKNLKCIWQSDSLPNILFPNLREVEVVRCSRLEMLFTTFTVKFLGQIEGLVVESCEDMKLIAGNKKGEEGSGTGITFSKLTLLRLFELPKFRNFLPEKYSLKYRCPEDFPSLQVCTIESCGAEPHQVHGDWKRHLHNRRWRGPRGYELGPWWYDRHVHGF